MVLAFGFHTAFFTVSSLLLEEGKGSQNHVF